VSISLASRADNRGHLIRDPLYPVVAATVYLTDYTNSYKPVTQVWSQELFPSAHKPTRTCIGVAALPAGTDVEITLTASPTPSTPLTLLNPPPSQDPAPLPFLTKSIALPPPTSLVFLSGTTAEDLSSSSPPPSSSSYTVADRTTASLSRIRSLLAQQPGSLGLEHIVSVTIYLTKYEEDFGPMNEAYMEAFREVRDAGFAMPSRTCVGLVDLPEGTDVEITVVAGARDQTV
jgi:2-iminobutanoate/2-iminopropanoate deaminase